MDPVAVVVAVLGVVVGGIASLMMLSVGLMGGANMKPADWPRYRNTMWAMVLGGLVCAGGGVALIFAGRAWWGAGVGVLPLGVMVGVFVWVMVRK